MESKKTMKGALLIVHGFRIQRSKAHDLLST